MRSKPIQIKTMTVDFQLADSMLNRRRLIKMGLNAVPKFDSPFAEPFGAARAFCGTCTAFRLFAHRTQVLRREADERQNRPPQVRNGKFPGRGATGPWARLTEWRTDLRNDFPTETASRCGLSGKRPPVGTTDPDDVLWL
jgi:hypothetical protein